MSITIMSARQFYNEIFETYLHREFNNHVSLNNILPINKQ